MSNYNWSPYAIGGATRPDSFSSMTPAMQEGLWGLLQASDAEVGPGLQVYSGYRSPELQGQLYQAALKKYGSEAAARKWVAPPGRSKHNSGQAADLKYNGVRIDKLPEDHKVRGWLAENSERFGLARPMSWEPWQVEVAGARSGAAPAQTPMAYGATGPAPSQPQGTPFAYGGLMPEPTAPEPSVWDTMAGIGASMMPAQQPQPQQMLMAPQAQVYQPTRRDTTQPYLDFFQTMRG